METLLNQGERVRCLVRRESRREWIRDLDVEWIEGDCRDLSSLRPAVEGVERVYHVAGITKATDRETFYRINTQGTENLVRACLEADRGVRRIVYLSSLAAAGPCQAERLAVETDPCWPVSHYGRSKREGEEAVLRARNRLSVVILRACAVYGPRDKDFLPVFRSIARGIEIGLWGIEQRLSLVYVKDLVSAIVAAGSRDLLSGEVFFISDGSVYTWREVGKAIAEALGVRTMRLTLPLRVFRWAAEISDWIAKRSGRPYVLGRERYEEMIQPNWCCDSTKATSELGLSPSFPLKQGVVRTVAWYREQGWLRG